MRNSSQPLSCRILARLSAAEALESNPWFADDLRIARLTVAYAASGQYALCGPHVAATYKVLGLHPQKVFPAILARRHALGAWEDSDAPPKKPAQSVSLWFEKTNGARAVNSRAVQNSSGEPAISVPMAAPSIAALYPNSDAPSSAKTRSFTLNEIKRIVGYSGAPDSICALTLSALRARGEWPNQDGPATAVLSVAIIGMMLEGVCCRSTVQRRIKRAVKLGYWKRLRDANSWTNCPKCGSQRTAGRCSADGCKYRGRSRDENGKWTGEFMRVPQYEFDVQKFRTAQRCREIRHFDARTYAEYKEAAKRGEHPNVTPIRTPEPTPPPKAPAPARRDEPLRKTAQHQQERRVEPKLSKTECVKFLALVKELQLGRTRHVEAVGGYGYDLDPGDARYKAPMKWAEAFATVCKAWRRVPEVVEEALAYYGYASAPPEPE